MIVDDELLARRMLKESIVWEEYGYSICGEAANGKEGLEKADSAETGFNLCGYQNASDERPYDGEGDSWSGTGL